MNGISNAELFFIISSVGFVILWVFVAIFVFYLIRTIRLVEEILNKAKKEIDNIGDITKETLEDIRDSAVFNFIFRKRRKKRSDKNDSDK